MRNLLKIIASSLVAMVFFLGCAQSTGPSQAELKQFRQQCDAKGSDFIFHQGECLETYVIQGSGDVINIVFHGNPIGNRKRGYLNTFKSISEKLHAESGLTTVYFARPDYSASSANIWKVQNNVVHPIKDDYIKFNETFVQKLLQKTGAKQANLIGFAAGATVATNVATVNPSIAKRVVSVAGEYNIFKQRMAELNALGGCLECYEMDIRVFTTGFEPIENVDKLDKNLQFLLISSSDDKVAPYFLAEEYSELLKEEGIKHKLVDVKFKEQFLSVHQGHEQLFTMNEVMNLTTEFIR